jgi:hypothetical protein
MYPSGPTPSIQGLSRRGSLDKKKLTYLLIANYCLSTQPSSTALKSGLSNTHRTFSLLLKSPSSTTLIHLSPCFIHTPTPTILQPIASLSKKSHAAFKVFPELTASSIMSAFFPTSKEMRFGSKYRVLRPKGEVMDEVNVERSDVYQNF